MEPGPIRSCSECRQESCSWIFSELSPEEFARFTRLVRHVTYDAGEAVFHEGGLQFGVYVVCRGKVKVVEKSPNGKRQILKLLRAGEILGEESLFADGGYIAFARTLEPSTLAFITKDKFLEFIKEHPSVTFKLLDKLARELVAFRSKLVEVAYGSSEERLARLLLAIGEQFGRAEAGRVELGLDLSRTELAELAGVAPETAIRTLARLREARLIQLEGHRIILLDPQGLRQLARPLPIAVRENLL
ncbi:MAG: Crp/Fnr family transcriptional regulator [Candidatus Acetothermia bacterium]|jgi:CRP/FNR family transcriptional regulator|nr:Crp/Fnr family transcriptional regulator [Candidatus Acetothermia bacterium]MDH7505979.1 Crp/Fnr family transcriptional regulator [Candidatus Acetothermia bacterium]